VLEASREWEVKINCHTRCKKQPQVGDHKLAEAIKKSDAPRASQIAANNMMK